MKAIKITPSRPRIRANGSKKSAHKDKIVEELTRRFAISHKMSPAGMADATALPKTKAVLSNKERTITLPTCGGRYGGSSRVNADGMPRKSVADRSLETAKVANILKMISNVSNTAEVNPKPRPCPDTKNIEIIVISKGNLPLQGTKEFVNIAIICSRGESMIRQPTTPAALHPNPMHIVSACLPQL